MSERKPRMKYWIKERENPQLGTYYVPCGQMPAKEARKKENSLHGVNIMHSYRSKAAYEARLEELREKGEKISGAFEGSLVGRSCP